MRVRNVAPVFVALASLDLLLDELCPNDAAQLGLDERVLLVAVQLHEQLDVRDTEDEWEVCCGLCVVHIYIISSRGVNHTPECSTWNISQGAPLAYRNKKVIHRLGETCG